jgi:hypothetical protein
MAGSADLSSVKPIWFGSIALVVAACSGTGVVSPPGNGATVDGWAPQPKTIDGLEAVATVTDGSFALHTVGGDRGFLPGVNIGATIPGTQPGEQAIPADVFDRWLPQIHDLGLRVVRVYSIMPPAFYQSLATFNRAYPDGPIYLMQGVWLPEDPFLATRDLFASEQEFHVEVGRAVAAIHGDLDLPARPGHASGLYDADVSQWLVAWVIGIELDPVVTFASDRANTGMEPYAGSYFRNTDDPTPTEVWLARAMDHLASLEWDRGVTMPIAFVNWPTTDPLVHPDEPLVEEDMVGIDANHVLATDAWPGGTFASYHAYPYYPDFQRYEAGIAGFELDGEPDNYAGYLTKLRDHHRAAGLPVMITEFGVPSSIGSAHHGPQGRNQGGHSEREAMAINAELMDVIHRLGLAGGLVFAWQDEWFKFTWNTIDLEIPSDRRQMWANPWTNEANFGLLAMEPGEAPIVVIDGDRGEWEGNGSQVILEARGPVREVRAVKDEGYLYLGIVLDEGQSGSQSPVVIGFDTIEGGASTLPGVGAIGWDAGDYAITISPGGTAEIKVRASADPLVLQYAPIRAVPFDVDVSEQSTAWTNRRLLVNWPLVIPTTGEERAAEIIDVGVMIRGSSDPDDPRFDSRATWQSQGTFLEVRIPYAAIGFSDPSSLQAYRVSREGDITTEEVERLGIVVVAGGETHETSGYAWERWQSVGWRERPKAGIDQLRQVVERLTG